MMILARSLNSPERGLVANSPRAGLMGPALHVEAEGVLAMLSVEEEVWLETAGGSHDAIQFVSEAGLVVTADEPGSGRADPVELGRARNHLFLMGLSLTGGGPQHPEPPIATFDAATGTWLDRAGRTWRDLVIAAR